MNTWHESLASCSAPQENQYTTESLFPSPEAAPDSDSDQHPPHAQQQQHPHDGSEDGGGGRRDGGYPGYAREAYHDRGGYNDGGGYNDRGGHNGYDMPRGAAGGARGGRGAAGWAGYGGQPPHGHRYGDPY